MNRLFADASYYLALLNPSDELHTKALEITPGITGPIVTTTAVLTEVADALSRAHHRLAAARFIYDLERDPRVIIVGADRDVFDEGLRLYESRSDKDWSLTDCISFVVMEQHGLTDALTADRHFEQAGFKPLLR